MSTYDDIVNKNKQAASVKSPAPAPVQQQKPVVAPEAQLPTRMSYADMFQILSPYKPPTQQQLEAEKKQQKRDAVFSAIGDGISALSNLFFTTQGAPNMYNPKNSLSARMLERREKLRLEREAKNKEYFDGYLRAKQMDDNLAQQDRNWRHMLEREAKQDARYNADRARQEVRDEKMDARWEKQFEAGENARKASNELAWAHHNENKKYREDMNEIRKIQAVAAGAKGIRGKKIGFSDGQGNEMAVYENVWKGSWPQVFDTIVAEMSEKGQKKMGKTSLISLKTSQQKEEFVKQNWTKFPKAAAIMMALSKIDPATMSSMLAADEDFSQYMTTSPSSSAEEGDDDFSQYKVK